MAELVGDADQHRGHERDAGGRGHAPAVTGALDQGGVHECGKHAVLDQMGAFGERQPEQDHQTNRRETQADAELDPARSRLQPLRDDGQGHQDQGKAKANRRNSVVGQRVNEGAAQPQTGEDRRDHGQ